MKKSQILLLSGMALLVLVLLGVSLGQWRELGTAEFWSPLPLPTKETNKVVTVSATGPSHTPTAPSEDWPTLTPLPTLVPPTRGSTVPKPSVLPLLTSTPLPQLSLPQIAEGKLPENLWSILYLPLEDKLAVHSVLVDAQGQRYSEPEVIYDFRTIISEEHTQLIDLAVDPTGNWVAVTVAYLESSNVWLLDMVSQKPHLVSVCEDYHTCVIQDWSADGNKIILQLTGHYQSPSSRPDDFMLVDVVSDVVMPLSLPKTTLERFSIKQATFSPNGHFIAWRLEARGKNKITEVWLTTATNNDSQLLLTEEGKMGRVTWHPDSLQIAYSLTTKEQKTDIQIISVENHKSTSLLPSMDTFANPVWAPDGNQVAMTHCIEASPQLSFTDQKCNISVFDLRTNVITPVVTEPGRAYWNVSWFPDAGGFAFLSANDEELQVIWFYSESTKHSYPIAGYLTPYSKYVWLSSNSVDGQ